MKIANFLVKFTLVCILKKPQTNRGHKKLPFLFIYLLLALLGMQTQMASSSVADLCLPESDWGISKSSYGSTNTALLCCSFELGCVLLWWYN